MFGKDKLIKNKYLTYSKATAKANPTMIANEYDRIIDEKRGKIKVIEGDNNNCVKFEIEEKDVKKTIKKDKLVELSIGSFEDQGSMYFPYRRYVIEGRVKIGKKIIVELSKKIIRGVISEVTKNDKEIKEINDEITLILKEKNNFTNKYMGY